VPTSVFRSLVSAFVLNRLDYCNSLLVDLPANLLQRLQSVQNYAARLIYRLCCSEHITDALLSLHWLRIPECVEYKVAVLMYKALNGLAPPYLSSASTLVADMLSRRRLRSASTDQLLVPSYWRSTIGRRAFPIAGTRIWIGDFLQSIRPEPSGCDATVHYKSDKIVNFCGFRCATTSPITVFINVVF